MLSVAQKCGRLLRSKLLDDKRIVAVDLFCGAGGLTRDSFALCYQVRALDKSRLIQAHGEITEETHRRKISETLADCFDLVIQAEDISAK